MLYMHLTDDNMPNIFISTSLTLSDTPSFFCVSGSKSMVAIVRQ